MSLRLEAFYSDFFLVWLWLQHSALKLVMLVGLVPTVSPSHNMEGLLIVVLAALLYFSSLHLCRISKLLWCTGCCRKLKLSTLFKTAQGAASSCPWRSKTKEKQTEKRGKNTQRRRKGGEREKWQIRQRRRRDQEMQSSTEEKPVQDLWREDDWQSKLQLVAAAAVCRCLTAKDTLRQSRSFHSALLVLSDKVRVFTCNLSKCSFLYM